MMTADTCWRWELTPRELLGGFELVDAEPVGSLAECRPFACAQLPLDGTPFRYQLALSDRSLARDVVLIRAAQPELPLSGDRRAGVIVLDGEQIVASLVIPGNLVPQGYRLWVRPGSVSTPTYRRQGLAFRALVEWCCQTRRPPVLTGQKITVPAARALLAAHRVVVERAVRAGIPVSRRVVEAVEAEEETPWLSKAA
jgi:hypothetical protein